MSTNIIEKCGQLSIGGIDIYQFKSTVSLSLVNMVLTIKSNYIINIVYSVNQILEIMIEMSEWKASERKPFIL